MHTHTHIYYAWGKTVMMHPDDNKKKRLSPHFIEELEEGNIVSTKALWPKNIICCVECLFVLM